MKKWICFYILAMSLAGCEADVGDTHQYSVEITDTHGIIPRITIENEIDGVGSLVTTDDVDSPYRWDCEFIEKLWVRIHIDRTYGGELVLSLYKDGDLQKRFCTFCYDYTVTGTVTKY